MMKPKPQTLSQGCEVGSTDFGWSKFPASMFAKPRSVDFRTCDPRTLVNSPSTLRISPKSITYVSGRQSSDSGVGPHGVPTLKQFLLILSSKTGDSVPLNPKPYPSGPCWLRLWGTAHGVFVLGCYIRVRV